ncbi:MAG: hypothetical protein ACI82O_004367, partial [Patiriisocius sp.]
FGLNAVAASKSPRTLKLAFNAVLRVIFVILDITSGCVKR